MEVLFAENIIELLLGIFQQAMFDFRMFFFE